MGIGTFANQDDNEWVRVDRVENAIDNLGMVIYSLKTFSDLMKWKWAIIALHQTLYSFFIIGLINCGQKVIKSKRLITIIDAAKMLRDQENLSIWDNAKPLRMEGEQATAFVTLVKILRNNFEHFNTDNWSIEINMIENIIKQMTPVIRFLIMESNIVFFTEQQEKTVKELLDQLEDLILTNN